MSEVKTPVEEEFVLPYQKESVSFESVIERLEKRRSNDGTERRRTFAHLLVAPVHYEENYAYPLLVWLHDAGKTEVELIETVPKISAQNYVSVAPRGIANLTRRVVRRHIHGRLVDVKSWTEPSADWPETASCISEAENLVFDSIEEARKKFNINSRRVFLIGHGAGATMALRVGLRNPREFAGVVSIDGAFPSLENRLLKNWRSLRHLPILLTTGSAAGSTVSSLSSSQLRLMHTAGMTVVVRQYDENAKTPEASQVRMNRILSDVNSWVMNRPLNPQIPFTELFSQTQKTDF